MNGASPESSLDHDSGGSRCYSKGIGQSSAAKVPKVTNLTDKAHPFCPAGAAREARPGK